MIEVDLRAGCNINKEHLTCCTFAQETGSGKLSYLTSQGVPEVVDRSLKADCTDFSPFSVLFLVLIRAESSITLKATCAYK